MKRQFTHRIGAGTAVFALTLMCALLISGPSAGQPQIVTVSDETKHAGEFVVPVNKSQILQLDVPFADLLVGNANVADVLALTDRSIYVLGKTIGSTSLTIYGRNKSLIAVVDLIVTHDIEGLKARLFEVMPEERIEVRPVGGSLMLSGMVSSATRMQRALEIAERFAGEVANLMSVKGSQQVMLRVRFSEVSRNVTKNLSISGAVFGDDFAIISGFTRANPLALLGLSVGTDVLTGPLNELSNTSRGFTAGIGRQSFGDTTLAAAFDALEGKGLLKTLAEPNLIALSGDTASFLAGGEFPVPVAQEGGDEAAITVEFKEFGVSLAFTPTVLDDGLINLVVSPEVSAIDRTNSTFISGFVVPGVATRRATTTVELRDGQSFAIAGLLQSDFADTISQFPLLGDLPIIGTLFRSSEFERDETELVILVTPHLVQPAPAGSLATPTDNFVPPSDVDLFLFGRLEAPESGIGPLGAGAGGIDGSYGHIIK